MSSTLRICSACGTENRVRSRDAASRARCGSCQTALPLPKTPVDVDAEAFDRVVAKAKVPVLVDFWASWCAPCRMAAPEVAKVAAEAGGNALVLKVDTEASPDLAARFGVRGIPNFVVLKDGAVVRQQAGLVDARTMRGWLSDAA